MKRSKFVTETISCGPGASATVASGYETGFERKRGINKIEVRDGFVQAHVDSLPEPVHERRIAVLSAVASAGISIDFLKLTPAGLSFLVPASGFDALRSALEACKVSHTIQGERSIVMVFAIGIREEEGLLAEMMSLVISGGAAVDHVADSHDRLLIVAPKEAARSIAIQLEGLVQAESQANHRSAQRERLAD